MDIEFICADKAAHKSIHEAVVATLKDELLCGHINCTEIEEELKNGGHGRRAYR